jgi:hypothetical protein
MMIKEIIDIWSFKEWELMYTVMKSGTDYEERHFKAEPDSDKGGMLMSA